MSLKERIKKAAYDLGADLVGFGGIDRCRHAPPMMSPQGLYPRARTVIVMAIHHPDACIELGGEQHPQEIGPYSVQYLMNSRLDEMSYRLATFIERQGHGAVPIVSSNIWRYNEYKDLKAVFAPDVSHIYMAVVAGLADLGFNGLALSPEYGARNRFAGLAAGLGQLTVGGHLATPAFGIRQRLIALVTDAPLSASPLPAASRPEACRACARPCITACPSRAISDETVRLTLEGREWSFNRIDATRCDWVKRYALMGESGFRYLGSTVDLPPPQPVTAAALGDALKRHDAIKKYRPVVAEPCVIQCPLAM